MAEIAPEDCRREFAHVLPEKPWTAETPVEKFEPLINRIDKHTQSDLFRHVGKYTDNDDYYVLARSMDENDQADVKKTFGNGVNIEMHQESGWPIELILEDKKADLKETVHFSDGSHRITDDKVEYCGVSRLREFSELGLSLRAYSFEGGSVEQTGGLPVLKLEKKK